MQDFENRATRESAFAQTDRASGLLPPLHSSSFRASMNRPAARNSMNSTRAHWALDPHALEEAALARRGVLLARIVQGVNLHAVGLSEVELQRDGAQHVSLVNESLPSDQDSRGRSSCSTLSRRNHLELARGGGTFRICLLLPDGGVGGCGDAYASPWAQAAINLTGQPGKSSEVAEGSHAAAHVLWNAEGHLLVPEYYGESVVQVAVVWCPPCESSSSWASACTCSGGSSSGSSTNNLRCTCGSDGGSKTPNRGSASDVAAAQAAVRGSVAAAASDETWRGEVVVGLASFKLSDAVVKRCPPFSSSSSSPPGTSQAVPSKKNEEAPNVPTSRSNAASAATAASIGLYAQYEARSGSNGSSNGNGVENAATNNANSVTSDSAIADYPSSSLSSSSSPSAVSERPFAQWAQGVAAFALEASGHHSNDALSDPTLAKASSSSSSSAAHPSAHQRSITISRERTPPTPSSTSLPSSLLPLPRLPSPVSLLSGASTTAGSTSKKRHDSDIKSSSDTTGIRREGMPIQLATRKEAEALALEKFGVLRWQSGCKTFVNDSNDSKGNGVNNDKDDSEEGISDHIDVASWHVYQADGGGVEDDEEDDEKDDNDHLDHDLIGPPLLPWEGPDTYVVDLWVPITATAGAAAGIEATGTRTAAATSPSAPTSSDVPLDPIAGKMSAGNRGGTVAVRLQLRYAPLAAAVGRWPHPAEAARSEEAAAKSWFQYRQRSLSRQKNAAARSRLRANQEQGVSSPTLTSSSSSSSSNVSSFPPLPPFRSWSNSSSNSSSSSSSHSSHSSSNGVRGRGNRSGLDGGRSELHMAAALGLDQHLAALLSALGTCPAVGPSRRRGLVARALALRASAPPPLLPPSKKKQAKNELFASSRSTNSKASARLPTETTSQVVITPITGGTAAVGSAVSTLDESQPDSPSPRRLQPDDARAATPPINDQAAAIAKAENGSEASGVATNSKEEENIMIHGNIDKRSIEGSNDIEISEDKTSGRAAEEGIDEQYREHNQGETRGSGSMDHDQQSEAMGSLFRGSWPPVAIQNALDPNNEREDTVEVAAGIDYGDVENVKEARPDRSNHHMDCSIDLPHESNHSVVTAADTRVGVDHEYGVSSIDDGLTESNDMRLKFPNLTDNHPDETASISITAKATQPWASPRRLLSPELPQADTAKPTDLPKETVVQVDSSTARPEKVPVTTEATLPVLTTTESIEATHEKQEGVEIEVDDKDKEGEDEEEEKGEDEEDESGSFDSLVESSDNTDDSSSEQPIDENDEEEKEETEEKGETKDDEVEERDSEGWRNEAFKQYFAVDVFDSENSKTSSINRNNGGHSYYGKHFRRKVKPDKRSAAPGHAWRSRDSDGLTVLGFAIRGGAGFITWRPPRSPKALLSSPNLVSRSNSSAQFAISPQVIARDEAKHTSSGGSSNAIDDSNSSSKDRNREDSSSSSSNSTLSLWRAQGRVPRQPCPAPPPWWWRVFATSNEGSFWPLPLGDCFRTRSSGSARGTSSNITNDSGHNGSSSSSSTGQSDSSGGRGRSKRTSSRLQSWYPNASERCVRLLITGDPFYRPDGSRPNLPRNRGCGDGTLLQGYGTTDLWHCGSAAAAAAAAAATGTDTALSTSSSSNSTSNSASSQLSSLLTTTATHRWSTYLESILLAHFGDTVNNNDSDMSSSNSSMGRSGGSLRFNFKSDVGEASLWRERSFPTDNSTSTLSGVHDNNTNNTEGRQSTEIASLGIFPTVDSSSSSASTSNSLFVYAAEVAADDNRDALETRRNYGNDSSDSSIGLNSSSSLSLLFGAGELSQANTRDSPPPSPPPPQALHLAIAAGRPDLLSACLESFASVHPSNAAAAPNLAPKKARARQGGRASTVEGPLPRSLDTGGTSLQGTHDDNNEYGNYDNDDNNDSAATAAAADAAAADDDDDDEMNTWMKSVCAVEASLLEAQDPQTGLTPLLHACALAVCSEAKHRQILGASQTLRQQHSSHQTPSPLFAERNRTIAENGSTIAVITDATSTTEKVSNILDDPAASPVRQQQQRDSAKLKSRPQQRYRQHQWQQYRAVKDEGIAARVCAELLLEAGANLGAVNAQGDTALILACRSGDVCLVRCLLAAGEEAARRAVTSDQTNHPNHGDGALATNDPNANQGTTGATARGRNDQRSSSWWPRWPTAEERRAARAAALAQQEEQEMQAALAAVAEVERAEAEAAVAAVIAAEAAAAEAAAADASTEAGAAAASGATTAEAAAETTERATTGSHEESVSTTSSAPASSSPATPTTEFPADSSAAANGSDSAHSNVAVPTIPLFSISQASTNDNVSQPLPGDSLPLSAPVTLAAASLPAQTIGAVNAVDTAAGIAAASTVPTTAPETEAASATAATGAETSVESTTAAAAAAAAAAANDEEQQGPRARLPSPSHLRGHTALPWHRNLKGEDALSCACSGGHLHVVRLLVEGLHVWPDIFQQELDRVTSKQAGLKVAHEGEAGSEGGRSASLMTWPSTSSIPLLRQERGGERAQTAPHSKGSIMGIPASSRSAHSGRTALHYAAEAGEVEVCAMLLYYWAQSPQGALLATKHLSMVNSKTAAAPSSSSIASLKFLMNDSNARVEVEAATTTAEAGAVNQEVDGEKKPNLRGITGTEMMGIKKSPLTSQSVELASHASIPIASHALRSARWCRGLEHGTPNCRDVQGDSAADLARRHGFKAIGDAIDRAVKEALQAAGAEAAAAERAPAQDAAVAAAATAAVHNAFARLRCSEGTQKNPNEIDEGQCINSKGGDATWAEDPDYAYVWPDDDE